MRFLYPLGALAFLSLLAVLALYILKRRSKEAPVSSLLLWKRTLNETSASRPFQRLRKRLLLFLQLLMCALLAFSLMSPALSGKTAAERVLVFDLSASMQAKSGGKTRLALAVQDAKTRVQALADGTKVTVLLAGRDVSAAISRSDDKARVLAALSSITPLNGTDALAQAVSLARAMANETEGADVIVYSDDYVSSGGVTTLNLGSGADNAAISSFSLTPVSEGVAAFVSVANYGRAVTATLETYADGILYDVRELELPENGDADLQLTLPLGTVRARVLISQNGGAIATDDERSAVLKSAQKRRVLLVSAGNVFLEKALLLRDDVSLMKTTLADYSAETLADLYIFDGGLPTTLPSAGAILALAPDQALFSIAPGDKKDGAATLRFAALPGHEALTGTLVLSELSLKTYTPLSGGQEVLTVNGDAVLSLTDENGRRCAVLGFDVHNSNLPLKADFPLLVQNLLSWLVPDAVSVSSGECGRDVQIVSGAAVQKTVMTPSGRSIALNDSLFGDTDEAGVYVLKTLRADGTQSETPFVLSMAADESDVRAVAPSFISEETKSLADGAGRPLTPFFLGILLALLLVEWGVSRRGV